MASLLDISKAVRTRIWDNLPPLISRDAVRFDNMDTPHHNDHHFMRVYVQYVERERVCVGQRHFRTEGVIRLQVCSPTDRGTVEHETAVDGLRHLFDDRDLHTEAGNVIRTESTILQTLGEIDNYYQTNIISPFHFNEWTS